MGFMKLSLPDASAGPTRLGPDKDTWLLSDWLADGVTEFWGGLGIGTQFVGHLPCKHEDIRSSIPQILSSLKI